MGQTSEHSLGRAGQLFSAIEASYAVNGGVIDTTRDPTFRADLLAWTTNYDQPRIVREDTRKTRSALKRISRMKTIGYTLRSYLAPHTTPGTEPDLHPLFRTAFGAVATGGGAVTYSLADGQTDLGSAVLHHGEDEGNASETILGAWVDTMVITVSGATEPTVEFSGGGSIHGEAYHGQAGVDDIASIGTGVVGLSAATVKLVQVGAIVAFTSDAGPFEVTAVDIGAGTITVSPNPSTVQVGDSVFPFLPATPVAIDDVIDGISGSLNLNDGDGAVELDFTDFALTLDNGNKPITDRAFAEVVPDYIPGFRTVSGVIGMRLRRDHQVHFANRKRFIAQDLDIVIGGGAGGAASPRLEISIPQLEMDASGVASWPANEEVTITLPFVALSSSEPATDEISDFAFR